MPGQTDHRTTPVGADRPGWLVASVAILTLLVFPLFCLRYAAAINLWGDEAFSLLYAAGRWPQQVVDFHLDTYYHLLGLVTGGLGITNELLLRLVHVIPFAAGLLLGASTVQRVFRRPVLTVIALAMAVTLPGFVYYATNIRMYSWLFLAAMAFVDAVGRIASAGERPTRGELLWLAASGVVLVSLDYAGAAYYGAGLVYLGLGAIRRKRGRVLAALLAPAVAGLLWVVFTLPNVRFLLDRAGSESPWAGRLDAIGMVKSTYHSFRPGLELVNPAGLPVSAAILLPLVLLALVFLGSWRLLRRPPRTTRGSRWVLVAALVWLLTAPVGYAYPRLFLVSQFYMLVVLGFLALDARRLFRTMGLAAVVLVLVLNGVEAVRPTLRIWSLVSFRDLATRVREIGVQNRVDAVVISNNGLNGYALLHYLDSPDARGTLTFELADAEHLRRRSTAGGAEFLFVSLMDSGQGHFGPEVAEGEGATVSPLFGYLDLGELPYNRLWRERIQRLAGQPDAAEIYLVRPRPSG